MRPAPSITFAPAGAARSTPDLRDLAVAHEDARPLHDLAAVEEADVADDEGPVDAGAALRPAICAGDVRARDAPNAPAAIHTAPSENESHLISCACSTPRLIFVTPVADPGEPETERR